MEILWALNVHQIPSGHAGFVQQKNKPGRFKKNFKTKISKKFPANFFAFFLNHSECRQTQRSAVPAQFDKA